MVQGGRPKAGVESFRALLARAAGDDDARSNAVRALVERSVFAAVWPGSGDALRTLTNGSGEQAMPLFSGHDTLSAAAEQFGWLDDAGQPPMRELPAREAMEGALAHGVAFIVIDVGADHSLELASDEVGLMLAALQARARAAKTPTPVRISDKPVPPQRHKSTVPIGRKAAHDLAQRALEVATAEATAAVSEVAPARARKDHASAPVLALGMLPNELPSLDAEMGLGFSADSLPQIQAPAAVAPVAKPASDALTGKAAPGRDTLGGKLAKGRDTLSGKAAPKSSNDTLTGHAAPGRAAHGGHKAAVEPPPVMMAKAAAEARGASDDDESNPLSAAKAFAAKLGAGVLNAARDARGGKKPEVVEEEEASDEELDAGSELDEGALRPLEIGLTESLQAAIADQLRGFPEVEWACEVSDGTDVPVLGIRISPSFLTRTLEIEAAAIKVADKRGVQLRVQLLTDAGLMREARKHGNTFFPWKKRPVRK